MNRQRQLAERRHMLIAECALQRLTLVAQRQSFNHFSHSINTSSCLVNRLQDSPNWLIRLLAGGAALLPERAIFWAKSALIAWQIWRAIFPQADEKAQS